MDHGRRAHLLRAREEPRRLRPVPRPRGGDRGVRHRLPGADRARLGALRVRAAGVRGGEGHQRARHVARGGARVLPRAPRARRAARPRGCGADGGGAGDGLHGHADDGERVLPAVSLRCAGDGALAGAADTVANGDRARRLPRRLPHPPAGSRAATGAADRAAARGREGRVPPLCASLRTGCRRLSRNSRPPAGPGTLAARGLRRLRGGRPRRLLGVGGGEVVRVPRRRAQPRARRDPVRGADPPGADATAADGARPHLRRRRAQPVLLARARGGRVRFGADVPHLRAKHVLRRITVPDRAARVDRARPAEAPAGDSDRGAARRRACRWRSRTTTSSG